MNASVTPSSTPRETSDTSDTDVAETEPAPTDLPPELATADGFPEKEGTLDLALMQVDYDLETREDGSEYSVIHAFGRTGEYDGPDSTDDLEHVEIRGFDPYFYVPQQTVKNGDLNADDDRIMGLDDASYTSIRGTPVTRVYGRTPRAVGQIRDEYDHYEADILFPNRFLIDKQLNSGMRVPEQRADDGTLIAHESQVVPIEKTAPPRVCTFDIEVDDRQGFPEADTADQPILSLTTHDNYREEYVVWLYEAPDGSAEPPESLDGYEPLSDDPSISVRTFESEEMMLVNFITYLNATDPDVTCGWNFDDFDAPYVVNRLERLNPNSEDDLSADRLSRINTVWSGGWGGPDIKGRAVFDLLYAYQRMQRSGLDSYRLDAVGEVELDVGKEHYSGDIGDLWENDPERLLEYNLRDVELCVEIDRKQDIVPFWEEVRTFVGCQLEDAPTAGDAVDMYVLQEVSGEFVLPSKGQHEGEDISGGSVFDAISGREQNVAVLDLASLYPMCIATLNASPETKVDPDEYDGEMYHAPDGTAFRKEPDGFIRSMIDDLLEERDQKKTQRDQHDPGTSEYELYDIQQASIKVIMNALFGVSTWKRFRLYDREMGAATTATGREVLEFTEETVNDLGYEVTYGDTDSVLIGFGENETNDVIEKAIELEDAINDRYDEFADERLNAQEHRFAIEFEKLYRQFLQAAKKKRYAGHVVYKEGNKVDSIDITGFEYQRSDVAQITKEVQEETIEKIVRGESSESVKEYVHEAIVNFRESNVTIDDMAIPGGINKKFSNYDSDTAQVRGAKYANLLLGTNYGKGSKPKRLYLSGVHSDFWSKVEAEQNIDPQGDPLYGEFRRNPDVICFNYPEQIPEEFRIDRGKMLDKTLKKPISRVLKAIDISWDDAKSGHTQTGLAGFM